MFLIIIFVNILFSLLSPSIVVQPKLLLTSEYLITESKNDVKMLAVGDIMLDRYVETIIKTNGKDYLFAKVKDLFAKQDIIMGNLEGPVITERKQAHDNSMNFSFDPNLMPFLKEQGFTILNLANNHTYDHGKDSFVETEQHLKEANLIPLGNPKQIDLDYTNFHIVNGNKVWFIGFNATAQFDQAKAIKLLTELKNLNPDYLIVTIHWGDEYALHPNQLQKKLAHQFIDAGADVIIGHHPHVVQSIEKYKDKLIFYSLGNFIFDQYFSSPTQELLAVSAHFSGQTITYQLIPLKSIKSQPQPMDADESTQFLSNLAKRSSPELYSDIASGAIVEPKL